MLAISVQYKQTNKIKKIYTKEKSLRFKEVFPKAETSKKKVNILK